MSRVKGANRLVRVRAKEDDYTIQTAEFLPLTRRLAFHARIAERLRTSLAAASQGQAEMAGVQRSTFRTCLMLARRRDTCMM
ncbi:MAG: hypothetical protein JSU63_08685, partial [Phycisphaerales bacterium]